MVLFEAFPHVAHDFEDDFPRCGGMSSGGTVHTQNLLTMIAAGVFRGTGARGPVRVGTNAWGGVRNHLKHLEISVTIRTGCALLM